MPLKNRITLALIFLVLFYVFFVPKADASPLSDCQPIVKPSGYPIGMDWVDGPLGRHVFFFCAAPAHEYTVGFSCRYDDCNSAQLSASILKVARATDKTAAINAEWAAWVKWDCTTPPDEPKRLLCVERAALEQGVMTKALEGYVHPVWMVKPNGTSMTRPAFTLVNGVLGTREAARAPVGADCIMNRPTTPVIGSSDIRAEGVDGPAGVVTICTKGTP